MSVRKNISLEEAKQTANKLEISFADFKLEQFRMGMKVELEHGKINTGTNVSNDYLLTTGKIALAHLNEFPDYYTRLKKMETQAKKYWGK